MRCLATVLPDFLDYPVDGVKPELSAEQKNNRAKAAAEGAAPGGGNGNDRLFARAPTVDKTIIGNGEGIEIF